MGHQVKSLAEQLEDAKNLAVSGDADLSSLATEEIEKIKGLMAQQTVADEPNEAIIEIRAGTGGMEAELFAGDLWGMYEKYATSKNWKINIIDRKDSNLGGLKRLVARFVGSTGNSPYYFLKYESGVHRIQRIPVTEKKGRVHTSAATVAVLPVGNNQAIKINSSDIRIDVYRASGHGGQGVNTTDSAVRVTHLPTGIVVTCQDERSQIKNREKAIIALSQRIQAAAQAIEKEDQSADRQAQVGTGDRSEKIRTYNFPQDRITDHRIGKSWSKIDKIMAGDLEPIVTALHEKMNQSQAN